MKRKAEQYFIEWVKNKRRKPLVVRGARQLGKTWLVRNLANTQGMNLIELNFEKDAALKTLFQSNDPKEYISLLELHTGKSIDIETSLLFLDEIQAFPEMLAKLRWLYEDMPDLAVIATGSLLDFTLADHTFSMPVGRISYFFLEPFTFEEFLEISGQKVLVDYIENLTIEDIQKCPVINSMIHQKLLNLFKDYTLIGGMPEVLNTWFETNSYVAAAKVQQELLNTYRDDFAKYSHKSQTDILEEVIGAIPKMLGNTIKYSNINHNRRSEVVKKALDLIVTARIVHKVHSSSAEGIPLGATVNTKKFKTLFLDTGLVSAALDLRMDTEIKNTDLVLVNKGALAEQVAGQLLRTLDPGYTKVALYYWSRDKKGSEAEVDYLIQSGSDIIPIEVKAGSTGSMKSLHTLMFQKKLPVAVRLNSDQPSIVKIQHKINAIDRVNYTLLSLPLYMTGQIKKLTHALLNKVSKL